MNNHEERLRFERFWVENFEPDTFDDVEYSEILNTYDSNYIVTDDLNRSWLAWQARAKAQAVPEGFVLVPLDVVERCMSHICLAMCHQNNSNSENDVMQMDLEILESALEAQEPAND